MVSPPTVEWISPSNGNWDVASNWSTGTVPSSNDDVIIDVPGASPTVTISSGSMSVLSITASDPLSITGGSLTVAADSTIGGGLSMTGGSLVANGSGTLLTVTGTTTISNANLYAQGGATLSVLQLTSYQESDTNYGNTLEATGTGSKLSLPDLTSIAGHQRNHQRRCRVGWGYRIAVGHPGDRAGRSGDEQRHQHPEPIPVDDLRRWDARYR